MNLDPSLQVALAAALEAAINHALSLDPGTVAAMEKLEGKRLALHLQPPNLQIVIQLGYPISVASRADTPADCQLSGAPWAFLQLFTGEQHSLAKSGVALSGDTALLSALLAILSKLDVDWEAPLVKWLGDLPGHGLASVLRSQAQWLRQSAAKTPYFIGDYLTQELRLIPSAPELDDFCQQVDEVRAAAERLGARLALLTAKLPTGGIRE